MLTTIKSFWDCSSSDLFSLFKDVYSSADGMSETLDEKYPSLESFKKDLKQLQKAHDSVALVAEMAEKPVAYLTIRPRKLSRLSHTADLNMGVSETARNQGIGRLILQEGIRQVSKKKTIEIIYLMVRSDNTSAIHLYEKSGFEKLAILERDTKIGKDYFDGILMRTFVGK